MRRSEREIKDTAELTNIINKCKIIRIGMQDEQGIYVVPVNFGYELVNGSLIIYVHGANEGRKIEAIKHRPEVCVEMDWNGEIREGKTACNYTNGFDSIIGNGRAYILEEVVEKCQALSLIMKHQTGKEFEFNEQMVKNVGVFKIVLDTFTGKHHE